MNVIIIRWKDADAAGGRYFKRYDVSQKVAVWTSRQAQAMRFESQEDYRRRVDSLLVNAWRGEVAFVRLVPNGGAK